MAHFFWTDLQKIRHLFLVVYNMDLCTRMTGGLEMGKRRYVHGKIHLQIAHGWREGRGLGMCWSFGVVWKLKIPQTVRISAIFCLEIRLLTHENMDRRGFICDLRCLLCPDCALETALHMFFNCSYARNED